MASSVFIFPAFGISVIGPGSISLDGPILVGSGTAAAPSYSFISEPGTGILNSPNTVGVSINGTKYFSFQANGLFLLSDNVPLVFGSAFDTYLQRDAANTLALKNDVNAQTFRIYGTITGPKYLSLSHNGTNAVIDTSATSGLLSLAPTNATSVAIGKAITSLAGITAAGALGVPVVVASANISAQSSNATITSYVNPATDADFEVGGQMSVTASTALATTITCTYTDVANVARTMILPIQAVAGTFIAAGAISGAGATIWETPKMHIRAKASTTITILTSAGTFTGVTYSASATIVKLN